MSVGLKTLRIQIVHKKCKSEVILTDGMFDCEKCNKMSSEIECLKILKVAFSIVCINERFDLTVSSIKTVKAHYLMPISRRKKLEKRMLKTTTKRTFNIEDCTDESIQGNPI